MNEVMSMNDNSGNDNYMNQVKKPDNRHEFIQTDLAGKTGQEKSFV